MVWKKWYLFEGDFFGKRPSISDLPLFPRKNVLVNAL